LGGGRDIFLADIARVEIYAEFAQEAIGEIVAG